VEKNEKEEWKKMKRNSLRHNFRSRIKLPALIIPAFLASLRFSWKLSLIANRCRPLTFRETRRCQKGADFGINSSEPF
jgi:hypothetical protein